MHIRRAQYFVAWVILLTLANKNFNHSCYFRYNLPDYAKT